MTEGNGGGTGDTGAATGLLYPRQAPSQLGRVVKPSPVSLRTGRCHWLGQAQLVRTMTWLAAFRKKLKIELIIKSL